MVISAELSAEVAAMTNEHKRGASHSRKGAPARAEPGAQAGATTWEARRPLQRLLVAAMPAARARGPAAPISVPIVTSLPVCMFPRLPPGEVMEYVLF